MITVATPLPHVACLGRKLTARKLTARKLTARLGDWQIAQPCSHALRHCIQCM